MRDYVLVTSKHTTVFYLSSEGLATEMVERAKRFSYRAAVEQARRESADPGWSRYGFRWSVSDVEEKGLVAVNG